MLEDAIAAEIGMRRSPGTSDNAWRRMRVQAIKAAGLPDDYPSRELPSVIPACLWMKPSQQIHSLGKSQVALVS